MKSEATHDQLHTKLRKNARNSACTGSATNQQQELNERPVHTTETSNPTFPVQNTIRIKQIELAQELPIASTIQESEDQTAHLTYLHHISEVIVGVLGFLGWEAGMRKGTACAD